MVRVLITGVTGALGRAVVNFLMQRPEYQLFGLSSQSPSLLSKPFFSSLAKKLILSQGQLFLGCDYKDISIIPKIVGEIRPHYVLHLGASFSNDFSSAYQNNVLPTSCLLNYIQITGSSIRVVLVGSAAEYGVIFPDDNPIKENRVLAPATPYGLRKAWQTQLLSLYSSSVDVLCARVFNLWGEGLSESLFAGRLVRQIEAFKNSTIDKIRLGPLAAVRDYISTTEAARQLFCIMNQGLRGEIYHVGSGYPIVMRDFLIRQLQDHNLSESVVEEADEYTNRVGYDNPVVFADMSKTMKLMSLESSLGG